MTVEQLRAIFPDTPVKTLLLYVDPLSIYMDRYDINTPKRQAAFIAQAGHECGNFTVFQENLNYSANGLLSTFNKYFKGLDKAQKYQRKPQAIANYVYANRMDNGPESSGDGWKYRGRGIIQITGKANYKIASSELKYDFLSDPDAILSPAYSCASACNFWRKNGLNELSDKNDFREITRRINGGYNHYDERVSAWGRAKKVLSVK